jgi:hypothetical protein
MMTHDTALYRELIRCGKIRCRPQSDGGRCNPVMAEHEPGCLWEAAVILIYAQERAAESVETESKRAPLRARVELEEAPA